MTTKAYYNEFDKSAVQWLRNLIDADLIPAGDVDERSIAEVQPDDLEGYTQCHFFAGIGGWAYALRLAGWSDSRPVWTGSCPCQPFSAAGKRKGTADERHLWPEFRRLIAACQPAAVFGEQVASKDGRVWLSGVHADLEALGYQFGAADLCAASVGAPHIRQRLFWVADAGSQRSAAGISESNQREARNAEVVFHDRRRSGAWDNWSRLACADGKSRRIESGAVPLVDGIPGRVGRLRGYGNAIVPEVAAEFVSAYL